ncbi:MAG: rhomboid family intramembrane serine protease [Candidatus Woesearchaeota archaeon]|nr:rhomboid family intramembrane serine protease [Candidatus Woesearchaeota archaeon]
MKWQIVTFVTCMVVLYVGVFHIPASADRFSLVYENVQQGEVWRFFTYQFAHIDLSHLLENIVGFMLLGVLVYEIGMLPLMFVVVYLLTGIVGALPIWFVTHATILGASSAVYGGFGVIAYNLPRKYLKTNTLLFAIIAIIIFPTMLSLLRGDVTNTFIASFIQSLFHLSGLFVGSFLFLALRKLQPVLQRRKYRCLRGV